MDGPHTAYIFIRLGKNVVLKLPLYCSISGHTEEAHTLAVVESLVGVSSKTLEPVPLI